jgi:8-oxo-dGTP pyrophosphatase MutT (NUDIX family)
VQFGALPYRISSGNVVEVLLITSRERKRWIIPKGWPIKGYKPAMTAALEAYEEAGVRGQVGSRPLGHYVYNKWLDSGETSFPCEVQVFSLLVKAQLKEWPECSQRKVQWFTALEAAFLVKDDDLRQLILQFKESCRVARRNYKDLRGPTLDQ